MGSRRTNPFFDSSEDEITEDLIQEAQENPSF